MPLAYLDHTVSRKPWWPPLTPERRPFSHADHGAYGHDYVGGRLRNRDHATARSRATIAVDVLRHVVRGFVTHDSLANIVPQSPVPVAVEPYSNPAQTDDASRTSAE